MMFIRDYFRVLVPLFVLFAAYHAAIVPLLEPPPSKPVTKWPTQFAPIRDHWWEEFFAEGDWQRDRTNPPRVVKTESATLLYQSRETISETRYLIKPLTILIPQKDVGSSKRAILIRNNEGAEIQFKSPVDWTQELPPIVSGQLLGEISIYSPPDDASKNNGLLVNARELRINRREIFTNERIRMQYGNSLIEGRHLQIFLDKDLLTTEGQGEQNKSPFNGLDRLELHYVDRVHVGLEPGGLWPRNDISDIASRPSHATLTCGGSFEFHFHQSLATLKKGVHMEHIVQGLPIDMFDCSELQMQVGWQGKQESTPSAANADRQNANWKVERLEAFGSAGKNNSDHSGWLKLEAPGMQAKAQGQHLVMDIVNGTVTLSNNLPASTSREMTPVYLKREGVQVWSPEVQYQTASAIANANLGLGKPVKSVPNRLGALLAQGAGRAQMDTEGDSWKLSWGERLLVRPDPNEPDKDLVDIKGSANINSTLQGRFQAEQLYLWLMPTSAELNARLAPQYPDGNVPQWLPDRIEADGNVDVKSPTLRATVEKMQVWFEYLTQNNAPSPVPNAPGTDPSKAITVPYASGPSSASVPSNAPGAGPASIISTSSRPASDSVSNATLKLLPPNGVAPSPLKQPVAQKSSPKSNGMLSANPATPLVVTAKTMRAKVLRLGSESRVEDLILEGNFALTKNQLSEDTPWPFTVTGDSLRLGQAGNGTSDIAILGKPAKVAVGSGFVVAPELKLKQSENQFWIDHPGEILFPVEALQNNNTLQSNANSVGLPPPSNPSGAFNGFIPARSQASTTENNIMWHEAPRMQWGGRMTFDGRVARFGGGVTIHCRMETDPKTLWHVVANANQMSVEMDQPVLMRSDSGGTPVPKSQIAMIRLEDNVDLQAVQTDLQMLRRSIEHMKVPQLDIMVANQLWLAHGPGEIWSRRLGNDSIGSVLPNSGASTSFASNRSADATKQCIHLSFAGRMEGDMAKRKATFYDRILALIGPIHSWDDALNVHSVDRPGRNQSILNSDQLQIFDASGLSWNRTPNASNGSAWEIAAQGRVQMQSNTEAGEVAVAAATLKYAAASDTVRIEGSPQQPAQINRAGINSFIRSASYRLKTGEFEGQISRIEGDVPASLQQGKGAIGPTQSQPTMSPNSSGGLQSPRDIPLRPGKYP